MKYLPVIFLLLLITTQTVYSLTFLEMVFSFVYDIFKSMERNFHSDECPGICVPTALTFICATKNIDHTVSCPSEYFRSKCCGTRPVLQTTTTEADYIEFITASPVDRLDGPSTSQDNGTGIVASAKPTNTEPSAEEKKRITDQSTVVQISETKATTAAVNDAMTEKPARKLRRRKLYFGNY